ncbi:MAG: hypothetical protein ACOYIP_05365 [Coriobacteriales bacterium]
MATAVISGRVDTRVQQKADVVLRKAGLTPTDIIQRIWGAMAATGEIPEVLLERDAARQPDNPLEHLARFLESLPAVDTAYADMSDNDILALKVADHA